jgi:hypothetical protein
MLALAAYMWCNMGIMEIAVLVQASHMDGFCFNLLKIAATEQQAVPAADVRQVAAIYLKNAVKRRWGKPSIIPGTTETKPEDFPLTAKDKADVMTHIHECVIRWAPHLVFITRAHGSCRHRLGRAGTQMLRIRLASMHLVEDAAVSNTGHASISTELP